MLYNIFNLPIVTLFPHLTTPTHVKHTKRPDTARNAYSKFSVRLYVVIPQNIALFWILVSVQRDNWLGG